MAYTWREYGTFASVIFCTSVFLTLVFVIFLESEFAMGRLCILFILVLASCLIKGEAFAFRRFLPGFPVGEIAAIQRETCALETTGLTCMEACGQVYDKHGIHSVDKPTYCKATCSSIHHNYKMWYPDCNEH